jgi:hypothetical protein
MWSCAFAKAPRPQLTTTYTPYSPSYNSVEIIIVGYVTSSRLQCRVAQSGKSEQRFFVTTITIYAKHHTNLINYTIFSHSVWNLIKIFLNQNCEYINVYLQCQRVLTQELMRKQLCSVCINLRPQPTKFNQRTTSQELDVAGITNFF